MTKQVIVVRTDLNMRKGKMAAQVAHAAMAFLTRNAEFIYDYVDTMQVELFPFERDWLNDSFTKVVVGVDSEEALRDLIFKGRMAGVVVEEIIDNGKTEFGGVLTLTCAAFGPDKVERLDAITGGLQLL